MKDYETNGPTIDTTVSDNPPSTLVDNTQPDIAVTTTLTAANDDAPRQSTAPAALDLPKVTYDEIVRRIKEPARKTIELTLKNVTSQHIHSLLTAMDNQKNLLEETSFIHDEMFPFVALEGVRTGQISDLQFGTLMALWGGLDSILPDPSKQVTQVIPEFVPLFTVDGEKNPRASTLLLLSLQPSSRLPNLVVKTPKKILEEIYDLAIHLPISEQGFWVVKNNADKPLIGQTITQRINKGLDVKFLAFNAHDKHQMIPSFGLQQLFLNIAFPHAVRLNPVIGHSTPLDIQQGSLKRYRDIAIPFPGNELPKSADNFPAPSALDFIFHDRYHSVRASRVTPEETAHYVAIGDKLHDAQQSYDKTVKLLTSRLEICKKFLPLWGKVIKDYPEAEKREIIEQARKTFNQAIKIINLLKDRRKSYGQLKFLIWDMEQGYSGHAVDRPEDHSALSELNRIISNIENHINRLGEIPGTVGLSSYSERRVAHTLLDTVKPEGATLAAMQSNMKQAIAPRRSLLSFFRPGPARPPVQRPFFNVIVEAPVPPYKNG